MAFWNSSQILNINEGTSPNDGTGDNIREAFNKVDENFANISIQLAQFNQDWTNANIEYNLQANFGNISNLFVANSTGTTSNFTGNSSSGNIIANTGLYSRGTSHFRGNLYMTGNILPTTYGTFNLGSPAFPFGNLYVQNTISTNQISASSDAGMLLVHANATIGSPVDVGIMGNISTVAGANSYSFMGYQASTNSFMFATTPVNSALGNSKASAFTLSNVQVGSLRVSNSTSSTSTTTGAVIVAGGVGVTETVTAGGNVTVGNNVNVTGNVYMGGYLVLTTNSLGVGNLYNGSSSIFLGNTVFSAATPSVSYTSGAVVVPYGGIGVYGNVVAGGFVGSIYGVQNSITSLTVGGNVTIAAGQMNIRAVQATSVNTTDLTATGTVSMAGVTLAGLANVAAAIINSTGNLNVTGHTNTVGNVSAAYFLGNGALLTGLTTNTQFVGLTANVTAANAAIQILNANVGAYETWANTSFATTGLSATTGVITNFSSGNIRVSGGYAQGLANVRATEVQTTNFSTGNAMITSCDTSTMDATTGVITNFSSGNIVVTGGYAQNLANVRATEVQTTNFSTGNATITSCDTSTMDATTGVVTNFSSGNIRVSGGYAQGLANVRVTELQSTNASAANLLATAGSVGTLVATTGFSTPNAIVTSSSTTTGVITNFSSGNIVVTSGYAQGLANVRVTELQSTNASAANLLATAGSITTLISTNFSTANAIVTNEVVTTGVVTNFSSGNIRVAGGYAQGLANVRATEGQFTNFSTGNAMITSCDTITMDATTGVITNFSSGNAQITGGSAALTNFSATTGVTTNFSSGNIFVSGGYITNLANISTTGTSGNATITGNINLTGSIIPSANVTSNLGDSTHWFGTLYGVSTQAKYADLAERYAADSEYAPGTVVVFGGDQEITVTNEFADARVAGAISTEPAYLMNAAAVGLPVALRGRIPCKVVGPVTKGDLLVTAGARAGYAVSVGHDKSYGASVFAKSLVTDLSEGEKIIEVVII